MARPEDGATLNAKHPISDFWRLALCYDGAASREDARQRMKDTWYSAYERARSNGQMTQALRYIGDLYADYYGWGKEDPANNNKG